MDNGHHGHNLVPVQLLVVEAQNLDIEYVINLYMVVKLVLEVMWTIKIAIMKLVNVHISKMPF